MTITAVKEVRSKREIDIEVPAYYNYGLCFYKILNEKDYIEVATDPEEYGVKKKTIASIVGLVANDGKKITPEEFGEAYKEAMGLLEEDYTNHLYTVVKP